MGRPAIPEVSRRRLNDVVGQLRALVPPTWNVRVTHRNADGGDLEVMSEDGITATMAVITRKRIEPRSLARLPFTEQPTLVFAEWLSRRTRELLRQRQIGFADSTGNVELRLARPALTIRTEGAQRDPNPKPTSGPTLRGPRAWALMRTLIEVRPPYTAGDLSAQLDIDNGYVSRVLQALVDDRLIEREPRRPVTDVSWEALLRQVVSSYSLFDSNETSTWVASSGPKQLLTDLAGKRMRRWAVSGSFAVSGLVSVTAAETAVIYTDDPERLAKIGRLLPTQTGANVVLARPFDPIVFDRLRGDRDCPRVSVAQTAIDLLTGNARMPEEGEALLGWMERNEPRWRAETLEG